MSGSAGDIRAGRAFVEVTAETSGLNSGLTDAQERLKNFARSFEPLTAGLHSVMRAAGLTIALRDIREGMDEYSEKVKKAAEAGQKYESSASDIIHTVLRSIPGLREITGVYDAMTKAMNAQGEASKELAAAEAKKRGEDLKHLAEVNAKLQTYQGEMRKFEEAGRLSLAEGQGSGGRERAVQELAQKEAAIAKAKKEADEAAKEILKTSTFYGKSGNLLTGDAIVVARESKYQVVLQNNADQAAKAKQVATDQFYRDLEKAAQEERKANHREEVEEKTKAMDKEKKHADVLLDHLKKRREMMTELALLEAKAGADTERNPEGPAHKALKQLEAQLALQKNMDEIRKLQSEGLIDDKGRRRLTAYAEKASDLMLLTDPQKPKDRHTAAMGLFNAAAVSTLSMAGGREDHEKLTRIVENTKEAREYLKDLLYRAQNSEGLVFTGP